MKPALAALTLGLWLLWPAVALPAAAPDFSDLAFQPHPGTRLPLDTVLRDEQGHPAALGNFFTGKPVVLVLEYLRCRTLCGVALDSLVAGLDSLPLDAGTDFALVAVSIDPHDTAADAAAAKAKYLAGYTHPDGGRGMHFLTGAEPAVRRIADAVGFPYRYDAALDQYLHPAGFVLAAPDGTISRYVFGVGPSGSELQAGLADAAKGRTIDPLTRLLLLCHFDGLPVGRYTLPIEAAYALANLAALSALVAVFAAIRRRRHR